MLSKLGIFLRCLPQKSALAGRRIRDSLVRLSWRLTGPAGQAQRPEQKSVLAGRRILAGLAALWLACLPVPGATAVDCTVTPEKCCNGYAPVDIRVCNYRGTCYLSPSPFCVCTVAGWTGTWCDVEMECGTSGAPYYCNGHGQCQSGHCQCQGSLGYTGKACDVPLLPRLQPTALDFGALGVGGITADATVVLNSWMTASIVSIALGGADAGDFALDGGCAAGTGLSVQSLCTVGVRFAPTAPGVRNATLSIVTSATATPLTAALTGTGTVGAQSLLLDPAGSGRLYAGLDGGGVQVSSDGGAHWTAATVQPGNPRVKALAQQSGTPLYAGTYGGGVFKAAAGTTAFAACATQPANLKVLSLSLDAAGKLYAGTEAGAYASADGCASWTAINGGLP
mgnify:CR=1 FL=1